MWAHVGIASSRTARTSHATVPVKFCKKAYAMVINAECCVVFFVSDSTEENFLHKTAFWGFVKNRFSFHFIVLLVAIKRMFLKKLTNSKYGFLLISTCKKILLNIY